MPVGKSNLTASRIKKLAIDSDYMRKEIYASDGGCKYLGVKARGESYRPNKARERSEPKMGV